jgi:ketosteroid isomerase-like protein
MNVGCRVLLITLGAMLFVTLAAAEPYDPAAAQKYIVDSEAAWAQSVTTNDASVVRRILADDVVWVLDGEVLDKAHAVADAVAGPGDFLSNQLEYAHVRFFGDVAVVQGAEHWTRRGGRSGRFVWTDTWLRRNGEWQIVASQDTSIADKRRPLP